MVQPERRAHILERSTIADQEKTMRCPNTALALAAAFVAQGYMPAQAEDAAGKPTIVLVHGAFADASSWNGVVAELQDDGYRVIAAANPLRGVASDAASISALVKSVDGPVVLVGHSYGGPVITEAANGVSNVTALVYVAGFLPESGESSFGLSAQFPGSTLGETLVPVSLPDGGQDLYIGMDKFPEQFAADVPAEQAALMAATQRPVMLSALEEPSGVASWKSLPSYMIYGSADRNIPPAVMAFMADRADAKSTVVLEGASHALMVSHPIEVAEFIESAAEDTAATH
jgi:pimeloyl-ACP methyl ester carboxylesterase